jgi:hypothetical protein
MVSIAYMLEFSCSESGKEELPEVGPAAEFSENLIGCEIPPGGKKEDFLTLRLYARFSGPTDCLT